MKPAYQDKSVAIYQGHVLDVLPELPDESIHCSVTSPPYWGLRDYGLPAVIWPDGWKGSLGLEPTPELYVEHIVAVFREVRRVLRKDGTLWLNIGDTYCSNAAGTRTQSGFPRNRDRAREPRCGANRYRGSGYKSKDLVGLPWLIAFALRADGWYLRSEIIWHKPNPMPESVRDRPTKAHEQIFLFSKSARYFYDQEAIKEPTAAKTLSVNTTPTKGTGIESTGERVNAWMREKGGRYHPANANKRSVWTIENDALADWFRWYAQQPEFETLYRRYAEQMQNKSDVWQIPTAPFPGAHFAVFPPDLIKPCILAGTSAEGCCAKCGAPWQRITKKTRKPTRPGTNSKINRASDDPESPYNAHSGMVVGNRDARRHCTVTQTTGWKAGCHCEADPPVPCTVLDPFLGSGTTAMVAKYEGRRVIGIELNPEYIEMAKPRLPQEILPLGAV